MVFLELGAPVNFHRMYDDAIAGFDAYVVGQRQAKALKAVELER